MQSRMPDQAPAQTTTLPHGNAAAHGAALSVRLWAPGEAVASGPSLWQASTPAVCLAIDLIAASQGNPGESNGQVLTAHFSGLHTAISAARRLQWAMQGFAESENLRGTAIAILVHCMEDAPGQPAGEAARQALKEAEPGRILLSEKASKLVEDLPGFSMGAVSAAGVRELLWRGPEDQSTRAFDEQTLSRIIELKGLDSADTEAPAAGSPGAAQADRSPARDSAAAAQPGLGAPDSPGRGKLPWLIAAGCAAALILAAVLIFHPFRASAPPAANTEQAASSAPATPEPGISQPPNSQLPSSRPAHLVPAAHPAPPPKTEPAKPQPQPEAKKVPAEKPVEQKEEPKPAPTPTKPVEAPRGCELDRSQLNDMIDQAGRSLARGKYRDAQRQYGSVLACDPGNPKAREGQERVRQAIAASGSSSQ